MRPSAAMNSISSGISVFFIQKARGAVVTKSNSMPASGASWLRYIRPCICWSGVSASSTSNRWGPALVAIARLDFSKVCREAAWLAATMPTAKIAIRKTRRSIIDPSSRPTERRGSRPTAVPLARKIRDPWHGRDYPYRIGGRGDVGKVRAMARLALCGVARHLRDAATLDADRRQTARGADAVAQSFLALRALCHGAGADDLADPRWRRRHLRRRVRFHRAPAGVAPR